MQRMFASTELKKLYLEKDGRKHNEQWGWGDLAGADSSVYMCGYIPYVFTITNSAYIT